MPKRSAMSKRRREEAAGEEGAERDVGSARRTRLLTGSSWWLYRIAPLHAFDAAALAVYAEELAHALALPRVTTQVVAPRTPGLRQSFVELAAFRSQAASQPALRLVLCPPGAASAADKDFAFFPLLLARGPVALRRLAVQWLERRFDAVARAARLAPHQLRELVARLPPADGGSAPFELAFRVPERVRGVRTVAVALAPPDARALAAAAATAADAPSLTDAVAAHVLGACSVRLSALSLVRVATPGLVVGAEVRPLRPPRRALTPAGPPENVCQRRRGGGAGARGRDVHPVGAVYEYMICSLGYHSMAASLQLQIQCAAR